jgi:Mrp family chromosome partitioning ATPase/capsular polysaccharide biosynthesis protein
MEDALTLHGFLSLVRRRKWIIVTTVVLLPLVAIFFTMRQEKVYQASARVLLSYQDLAGQLTGTAGSSVPDTPNRTAETQASVAKTFVVASRVMKTVRGTGLSPGGFLAESSVTPNPNADLLGFTVTDRNPVLARRLVNAYAAAYVAYRHELDDAPVVLARRKIRVAMNQLGPHGRDDPALYRDLLNHDQTLATIEALQTASSAVIQQARGASRIGPLTKRNALLAGVLGLILGLAIAFLWDALDTRVRTVADIGKQLGGLPLLAALHPPKKQLQSENRLVMMEEPDGSGASQFGELRANLELAMLDRGIRTIMVTSPMSSDGKSTTIANLAVSLARYGKRVALVDLDLVRPKLGEFFRLEGPGVTNVVLGHLALDDALVRIAMPRPRPGYPDSNRAGNTHGGLYVLPAGAMLADRGAVLESGALTGILESLRELVDLVLVDTTPALQGEDALILARKVDGIIVVTRLNGVRRPMLSEIRRRFAMTPARVLGFVATGSAGNVAYGDGEPSTNSFSYGIRTEPAIPRSVAK